MRWFLKKNNLVGKKKKKKKKICFVLQLCITLLLLQAFAYSVHTANTLTLVCYGVEVLLRI